MGRIVYFRVDLQHGVPFREDVHPDSLFTKLESDPNSVYHDWVKTQLQQSYNYICTDRWKTFNAMKKALNQRRLIKNNERHEKDEPAACGASA
jgi:uncharacterized protein YPO0396